jgi:hypothetical protein
MASLKVTYEAPPGLKKNLQRTYEAWTPDFMAEGGSAMRAQLFFVLAWFHAIVQERRTFVPQVRVKQTSLTKLKEYVDSPKLEHSGLDLASGREVSPTRAQLLFVLAWFHAIIQERRTFVPQVKRLKRSREWTQFSSERSRDGHEHRPHAKKCRVTQDVKLPTLV